MDAVRVPVEGPIKQSGLDDAYRRAAPRARALAYLLTGNRETAEDLAQDAFVRLAGRFQHIRKQDALDAYLRRTVVNLHLSRLRRLRLERAFLRRQSAAQPASSSLPDVEIRDELLSALRSIPSRQRVGVVLRYCLDLSESQVAESMGCSTAAARHLVARGIKRLREELGRDG